MIISSRLINNMYSIISKSLVIYLVRIKSTTCSCN